MTIENLKDRLNGENEPIAPMVEKKGRVFTATVGELLEAVKANPKHPVAKVYAKALAGKPEDKTVTVDRVDIEALLDNRKVETSTEIINGVKTETKRIGDKLDSPAPPAPAKK